MANKQEKFFELLDCLNKADLEILLFIAKEINIQFYRYGEETIAIDAVPDGLRSRVELDRVPGTPHSSFKDEKERENDVKWTIGFLEKSGAIEQLEANENKRIIVVFTNTLKSIIEIIKQKYDIIIPSDSKSNYEHIDGILFYKRKVILRLDSDQRKIIFEQLWDSREEIVNGTTTLDGERQPTAELTKLAKFYQLQIPPGETRGLKRHIYYIKQHLLL